MHVLELNHMPPIRRDWQIGAMGRGLSETWPVVEAS
jgi:hypothetical protein